MEKNPYKILGVSPVATEQEVIKAYRKQAMKVHPDRGGSDEEFAELNDAYCVIGNAALRKRYDETGDWEKPEPDNVHANAVAKIVEVFEAVVQQKGGTDLEKRDLAADIQTMLRQEKHKLQDIKRQLQTSLKKIGKVRERFKSRTDKPPIMHVILDDQLSKVKKLELENDKILAAVSRATELCGDQFFDRDVEEYGLLYTSNYSSSSF